MRFFVGHIAAEKLLHGRLFQHAAETQATPRKPADVAVVRFVMSPKRVWRDLSVQIELGVEIANLGGE